MLNDDWKKEYKAGMDRQIPSEQSLNALKREVFATSSKTRKDNYGIKRLLPAAACFLLLAAIYIPVSRIISGNNAPLPVSPEMQYKTKSSENGSGATNPQDSQKIVPPAAEKTYSSILSAQPTTKSTPEAVAVTPSEESVTPSTAPAPPDYTVLFNALSVYKTAETSRMLTGSAPNSNDAGAPLTSSAKGTKEHSETNIQISGVQEADIVKTDGDYIYTISNDKINIVKAENGYLLKTAQLSGNTKASDGSLESQSFEMYVSGNRLIVLRNSIQYHTMTQQENARGCFYPYYQNGLVSTDIYDISDKAAPKLIKSLSQDGYYVSSRMVDGVLYLLSNKYINGEIKKDDPSTFVPQVNCGSESRLIAPDDISISIGQVDHGSAQYLIITGIDTSEAKLVSDKAVLGYGNQIYASKTNLYVTGYAEYKDESTFTGATKLYRFSLDNGNIKLQAEGTVPGTILNQFSMDEYNGFFRIVTTVNTYTLTTGGNGGYIWNSATGSRQYNCLYVLGMDLLPVGKIENLAPGEQVYSVRLSGDTGYFVTFRQVDPLFTVDLKVPSDPKVLSALKIPGFSQYLHPFSDGLLFGIGRDADEASGKAGFLKLSMFDTRDPYSVVEANKLIIDGVYYSEASYNHKAILVDSGKNIIAFPANEKYLIYSYSKENGFTISAEISFTDSNGYGYIMRGIYIGDYFYVISDGGISSYKISDYKYFSSIGF